MCESLRALLDDPSVPAGVREALEPDYRNVAAMLDKLEHGHIHIAAFGRVGVGKSSLLNALMGKARFHVSPLHGATAAPELQAWEETRDGSVFFVDTPGIDEIDGDERERLARQVAERCDLVLFVVEGDLTASEHAALRALGELRRPLLLVLNKADRYTDSERALLLDRLRQRADASLLPEQIVSASADPREQTVVRVGEDGAERECRRRPPPDVDALRGILWAILEREGKILAALNAGLFAGRLSDEVAARITRVKHDAAARVIRGYCLAKGVAVGLNPVPVADLLTAAALDVSLVVHLSRIYALPATRREAGALIRTIATQMGLLMGTVWGINLAAAGLKGASAGLSTALTAGTQGAVAYYATYVVGRSAERYFAQGKSWGPGGPRRVVERILDDVDRDSLLRQARADIRARLRGAA